MTLFYDFTIIRLLKNVRRLTIDDVDRRIFGKVGCDRGAGCGIYMKDGNCVEEKYEKRIAFAVRNVNILIKRRIDRSESKILTDNVTGMHGYVICYLMDNRDKDVFQKDIEKRFSIRRSTCTNILNLMQKNGLISRSSVESDARLKKISLTPKAEELFSLVEKDRFALEDVMRKGLSESEINTLYSLLARVAENLKGE